MAATYSGSSTEPNTQYEHEASSANRSLENEKKTFQLACQFVKIMSGLCHLDRASNVEIGVEYQIFVIVIFFNYSQVLQCGAHSSYQKGALSQKRSVLVICNTFRSDFHVG